MGPEVDRAVRFATERLGAGRVRAIWLFGSRARGEQGPGSDLDLAVLADPALSVMERARLMDLVGIEIGMDVDVVDLATAQPALAWEILTTGALAFDDGSGTVENFIVEARHGADDAERRDRMVLLAWADSGVQP